jgi:hypothetical protein
MRWPPEQEDRAGSRGRGRETGIRETDGVVASAARSLRRPVAGVGANATGTGVPRTFGIAEGIELAGGASSAGRSGEIFMTSGPTRYVVMLRWCHRRSAGTVRRYLPRQRRTPRRGGQGRGQAIASASVSTPASADLGQLRVRLSLPVSNWS